MESSSKHSRTDNDDRAAEPAADVPESAPPAADRTPKPREIGGRDGPDPTRYGDWEKNGRCIDF